MQKILSKRLFRDFRTNFMRYISLFLLITVGMYIVISLIAVSEAVTYGTKVNMERSHIEDGEFTMMVPLSESDFSSLEHRGVTIEPSFYMDYQYEEDGSIMRIFQNREEINKIQLDDGELAKNENEIVLEKIYAMQHELQVGDTYELGGRTFHITGIGSVVDYDEPLQENSSIGADSSAFGIGFVSAEMYTTMRGEGLAEKSETYLYSYVLNDAITNQELKKELSKLKPELAQVQDTYIQEMLGTLKSTRADLERGLKDLNDGINDLAKGRNELQSGTSSIQNVAKEFADGTNALASGSNELKKGTAELASGSGQLLDGSSQISDGAKEVADGAAQVAAGGGALGSSVTAFADGAKEVDAKADELASGLEELQGSYAELAAYNEDIQAIADGLRDADIIEEEDYAYLSSYVAGVEELGEGINLAAVGSRQLQAEGTAELAAQVGDLSDGVKELQAALVELQAGSEELQAGTAELNENLAELKAGSAELDSGAKELVSGANEINGYASDFQTSLKDLQSGTKELSSGVTEFQKGTNTLRGKADELIRDYLKLDIENMTMFQPAIENARIDAAEQMLSVFKSAGIIVGIILSLLFGYVISVFISHGIEREGMVIGALYSLGINKRELMMHYLTLPVILTFLGGVLGTAIGFSPGGMRMQLESAANYYSIPYCEAVFPPYLVLYGILLPPVITAVVNYFIINKKLSATALSLLKNEKKQSRLGRMNLGRLGFLTCFRIRQFCKEFRSSLAIMVGIFISLLLVILSFDVNALCQNQIKNAEKETSYNYMYQYKYPPKIAPEGGETFYVESLIGTARDITFDVSVWGMYHNNSYFDVETTQDKNRVIVSEAVASKFDLDVGDKLVLTDSVAGVDYAFEVAGIAPYAASLGVYMDMSQMQELFGQSRDYYNVVLSDHALDLDAGRLFTVNTKDNIVKAAHVSADSMQMLTVACISVGIFVLLIVMYLMMKVAMDRASFQISLMKIFGFRSGEVRKLYLDGNFFVVVFTLIAGLPLAKKIVDTQFPYLMATMACANDTSMSWLEYLAIAGTVLVAYIVINWFLVRRIKKVTPAEVLKNRE